MNTNSCFAAACIGCVPATDAGTIEPIITTTTPTASLSISNPNMTSNSVTPGEMTTVSTNVTVNIDNADSYSLSLKVNDTTLKNGSTVINAGNAINDNTWGYKWDNAASFTAPSSTGINLAVPTLNNGTANFTKNLTFGIKFGEDAETGHYKSDGTLSLIVTPKTVSVITLANLTQMQQLTLAPEACTNTPYLSGQNYSAEYTLTDVRDNNTYTVRKLADGKCWMTENLKLTGHPTEGRTLINSTSDISAATWTLPAPSNTSGFTNNSVSNIYYDSSNSTGYYTWCAAIAGSCSSITANGQNATSSICPKGWKLPTGGTGGNFQSLVQAIGVTSSSEGSTKLQNSPYNFTLTGYLYNGATAAASFGGTGYWWSRTVYKYTNQQAYHFYIDSSNVIPTSDTVYPAAMNIQGAGLAIRCIAG